MPVRCPRPPPSFWRLNTLNQEKAQLWNTTYNPKALRLGNKILKRRPKAPVVENYYPPEFNLTPRTMGRLFPGLSFRDVAREQWEEDVEQYSQRRDLLLIDQEEETRQGTACEVCLSIFRVLICLG